MLRDEVINLCKQRYPSYSLISFNEEVITIHGDNYKKLMIELDYSDYLDFICPYCNGKNYHVQTANKKDVYDIGYKDYLVYLRIPNYYFECNNKNCNSLFLIDNDIVKKKKNFSNKVRNVILENSELSCRKIANKLLDAYKVKISFDQVNQILKELESEQKTFEEKKDISILEYDIDNKQICKVFSYSSNPADYFPDTVFSKYDLINIF